MEVSQALLLPLISIFFVQFLMRLQSQDYISANQIQQELARLIPNDPLIKQFAAILPDEAAYQEETMQGEVQDDDEEEGESEYYDEEEDGAEQPEEE